MKCVYDKKKDDVYTRENIKSNHKQFCITPEHCCTFESINLARNLFILKTGLGDVLAFLRHKLTINP